MDTQNLKAFVALQQLQLAEQEIRDLSTTVSGSLNLATIKMMVNVGLGWSVLPRTMLDDGLVELPVSSPALSRQLGYIFHRKHSLTNAARAFISLLQAAQPDAHS